MYYDCVDTMTPYDRSVETDDPNAKLDSLTTSNKSHNEAGEVLPPTRSVGTEDPSKPMSVPATPHQSATIPDSHALPARSLITTNSTTGNHESLTPALPDMQSDEFLPDLVVNQAQRSVETPNPQLLHMENEREIRCDHPKMIQLSTSTETPSRATVDNISQLSNTPRSVLTDPDDDELQSANALLQLSS